MFESVLVRMVAYKQWKKHKFAADAEAAAMHAELVQRMTRAKHPLLLVSSHTLQVFCGPPRQVLESFEKTGEDVHPASVCLSRRAVRLALEKRPRKKRKT